MKNIALTSANEHAMARVAELLLDASRARAGCPLAVHVGINDAHAASLVSQADATSELWRIGTDDSRPELDALVDREISDDTPGRRWPSTRPGRSAHSWARRGSQHEPQRIRHHVGRSAAGNTARRRQAMPATPRWRSTC
jgi:hypothetical protein